MSFRFDFERLARMERRHDVGSTWPANPSTRVPISVIAEDEASGREKVKALSGEYKGPGNHVFNGRYGATMYTDYDWVINLLAVEEVSEISESDPPKIFEIEP